jgi:hypothetical protein
LVSRFLFPCPTVLWRAEISEGAADTETKTKSRVNKAATSGKKQKRPKSGQNQGSQAAKSRKPASTAKMPRKVTQRAPSVDKVESESESDTKPMLIDAHLEDDDDDDLLDRDSDDADYAPNQGEQSDNPVLRVVRLFLVMQPPRRFLVRGFGCGRTTDARRLSASRALAFFSGVFFTPLELCSRIF